MKHFILPAIVIAIGAVAVGFAAPSPTPPMAPQASSSSMPTYVNQQDALKVINQVDQFWGSFAVSVYAPDCVKHGGVKSVAFAKRGIAWPADVTCRDNFKKHETGPK